MCRLLYVKGEQFSIPVMLKKFAHISQHSKEYQGHGWGCSYLQDGNWKHYKNIKPIWEDDLEQFGSTTLLIAHARSAFEDKDIVVENNMPFYDDTYLFIFNGELRGVSIKEEGRIGAEKIFNYVKRFDKGDMLAAMQKAVPIIIKRTKDMKAMNFIIADKEHVYVSTSFTERPEYFTMHYKKDKQFMICSDPFEGEVNWERIPNNTLAVY